MTVTLWIIIAMIFYTIGEYYSKKYANTSLKSFGVIALIGYLVNAFCFLPALSKMNSLTVLGTIWNVLYVIITLVIGLVIFRETITTTQMIGVGLGFISIILLSI